MTTTSGWAIIISMSCFKPLAEAGDHCKKVTTTIGEKMNCSSHKSELGECAGVVIDLVQTLFFEAEEKLEWAAEALKENRYADGIYHTYTAFVNGAKGLLLGDNVRCNTQAGIITKISTKHSWKQAKS